MTLTTREDAKTYPVPDWLDWINPTPSDFDGWMLWEAWSSAGQAILSGRLSVEDALANVPRDDTKLAARAAGLLHSKYAEHYNGSTMFYGVTISPFVVRFVIEKLHETWALIAAGNQFRFVRRHITDELKRVIADGDLSGDDGPHALDALDAMFASMQDLRPQIMLRSFPTPVSGADVTYARFAPDILRIQHPTPFAAVLPACLARPPFGHRAGPLLATDTKDVLRVTAGLWDTTNQGGTEHAKDVLAAARAVLSLPDQD